MEEGENIKADRDYLTYETNDMTYAFTTTTFTKTSRLPLDCQRLDGTPFVWFRTWNHERITNEARALKLISERTTIPVPQVLDHGILPDGRRYLVTKFVEGVLLRQFLTRGCPREDQKHTDATPCELCLSQAYSNAVNFIEGTVFPQLANLKSQTRGISGFVMPPSWLSPDRQPPWRGKKHWKTLPLETAGYIFQHGDISAHNIMMDPQTLQVRALLDWEYAGFFPPDMERWPGTLDSDTYYKRGHNIAHAIAEFLPIEYLECYEGWSDKAELDTLISSGQLPHPYRMSQDHVEQLTQDRRRGE